MDDSLSSFRIIFNMQNFLGEGGFETVRAAIRKSDNMSVAIKSVQHFWCYHEIKESLRMNVQMIQ